LKLATVIPADVLPGQDFVCIMRTRGSRCKEPVSLGPFEASADSFLKDFRACRIGDNWEVLIEIEDRPRVPIDPAPGRDEPDPLVDEVINGHVMSWADLATFDWTEVVT